MSGRFLFARRDIPLARSNRAELRESRYKLLRSLGYSSADATRRRDWSAERIDADIIATQRRISKKRVSSRSETEQERLEAIRDYRHQERDMPVSVRQRTESRKDRLRNFSDWSKAKEFPAHIQGLIDGYNEQAGFSPLDSYGYRLFYWQYVRGLDERESKRQIRSLDRERRDT